MCHFYYQIHYHNLQSYSKPILPLLKPEFALVAKWQYQRTFDLFTEVLSFKAT
jgi:hypothetical protein